MNVRIWIGKRFPNHGVLLTIPAVFISADGLVLPLRSCSNVVGFGHGAGLAPDAGSLRITFVAPTPTPTAPPHLTPTATPAPLPTPVPTDPPSSVPEPTTLTLFGLGAAALAYVVRHTRRRNNS